MAAAKSEVRLVESLIPGLGHIRRGYVGAGARFLTFFLTWWLIVVFRFDAVVRVLGEFDFDSFIAAVILFGLPPLLVKAAHRSLHVHVDPPPRSGLGTWQLAWRDLRRNPRALWGMTLLAFLYLGSFLAPVLAPYDPKTGGAGGEIVHKLRAPGTQVILVGHPKLGEVAANEITVVGDYAVLERQFARTNRTVKVEDLGVPPRGWARGADRVQTAEVDGKQFPYRTERYLLGTDRGGRDLLSRLLYGSRISLFIGFVAMFVAVTLGVLFGSLAGYFGGWVDGVIMRFVDILLAFPRLLLLLLIVSVYEGAGIFTVVVILGATGWMGVSRLVRAEFLRVKELDYAVAATSLGYKRPRIMFRHLLPNCMAPVIVNATLLVGNTILVEAALSYLGFGVKPPEASWGNIISSGQPYLDSAWWISTIPGLLIVFAVVCINLVGDALRDALDPKGRS
ncbi:MAG: ABC transporter permease [Planctomycetota bacterium]|nr:ABC transporter permease [Planctomycetota bacterium]